MNEVESESTIFYKYSAVKDTLIKNLENNQIYFNNPANFNDIADCKLNCYLEAKRERWIKELMSQTKYPTDRMLANFAIENDLKNGRLKKLDGNLIHCNYDEKWRSAIPLVSCFCQESNNPLMWGLYANNHKGVCLGYKSTLTNGEYTITLDSKEESFCNVIYEKKPPSPVNLLDKENSKNVFNFVRTKFEKWNYENESRIILTEDKQKKERAHKKEDLESVTFGSKIEYCDACRVYEVIKKNYLEYGIEIDFYKIKEIQGQYELEIEPIDIENFIHALRPY